MNVFLTGGTGYIGSAVAEELERAGHHVSVLVHRPEKADVQRARGRDVISGGLHDATAIEAAAGRADAVIHTAATMDHDRADADTNAVRAILAGLAGSGKPFVYTSGTWIYGNTGGAIADEDTPVSPTPLVAWREGLEKEILTSARERRIRAVVIRPVFVYGRGGGIPAMLFDGAAKNGVVRHIGPGSSHWSFVHVEDLANLYVRAVERAPEQGTVLVAAGDEHVPVRDVALAASEGAGIPGKVEEWPLAAARAAMGPFADALALDQKATGARARSLLGWQPKGPKAIDDLARGSYRVSKAP